MHEGAHFRFQGTLGYAFVAEAAVHRRSVVKAVAASARLLLDRHGGSLVAGVTTKLHGEMRIVEETSGGEGEGITGRRVMTEAARLR